MEVSLRKSITEDLDKYCINSKKGDYISVTEWDSGEGWDIDLNGCLISLHVDELSAINYLTKVLEYEEVKKS